MKIICKEQNKWITKQVKGMTDEERDTFTWYLDKKIPLKLIPIVDVNVLLNSINISGWRKENKTLNKDSNADDLADANTSLWEHCSINYDGQITKSRGWNIFYNEYDDVFMRSKGYLEEMMPECLAIIILDD